MSDRDHPRERRSHPHRAAIEVAQYFKALAERTQVWGDQHRDRANRYRARTDAVRAELTALKGETAGLNPVALAGRRDAVARIRAALATITHETQVPDDPRVTELEQQLADTAGELAEVREHSDRTCEAAARAEKAEAAIARVLSPTGIRAAAEAIGDEALTHLGRDLGTIHVERIAEAGLRAALDEQPQQSATQACE
ncbi:hypothetical protein OG298_45175 (plasmid) [Streptomyces sp. NBC_01005]|uniref:hypothetical protein n=1 Tax=Streptomyces sp. NBC_01005 TaxID=2903715 RepID=UPI002F916B96|nr:hypothetical protein OG298_45175 [Streptomyces sp. NBC_01005]